MTSAEKSMTIRKTAPNQWTVVIDNLSGSNSSNSPDERVSISVNIPMDPAAPLAEIYRQAVARAQTLLRNVDH